MTFTQNSRPIRRPINRNTFRAVAGRQSGSSRVQTLRYGPSTPASVGSSTATNTVWIPILPVAQRGVLTTWKAYFTNSSTYKIVVLRQNSSGTFDEVWKSSQYTATGSAINTKTESDFGTVSVLPGDLVGMYGNGGQISYTSGGYGLPYLSKTGDTAATGNTMTYTNTLLAFQMQYQVRGIVSPRPLLDESFDANAIPWDWNHASAVWSYSGGVATSGTAGASNSLNSRRCIGNLSSWTWDTYFEFGTASSRMMMFTRNTVQNTEGTAFEVNASTNNLVIYQTYTNNGAFNIESTNATGLTFQTGRQYKLTLRKQFRTLTFSVTDMVTGSSYSVTKNQEDGTASTTVGLGYGCPSLAAIAGSVLVTRTVVTPDYKQPRLLVVGDSITEGSGLTNTTLGFPRLVGGSVMTSAQGGASTLHTPGRVPWELNGVIPRRVVFLLGTNDTDTSLWQTKMAYMRDIYSGMCDACIVGAVPAEAADSNPESVMNPYIIAQGWPTARFDLVLSTDGTGANRIGANYYDTLHPNSTGHAAMYSRLMSDQPLI